MFTGFAAATRAIKALTLFSCVLLANEALAKAQQQVKIQLLAINDLHGNLEPPSGVEGRVNQTPAGGTEYLATHLHTAALSNPNTLLVAAGDLFGASPLLSSLSHDQPAIEAITAMHLSVTALGNHELDHGLANLEQQLKDAHIQYLAANMVDDPDPTHTPLPPTTVLTIAGVKIGFIGEILQDTPHMLIPQSVRGLRFLEESKAANEAAARLERQGVHTIVLLIHQGGMQHPTGATTDPNGCENFDGEIKPIAEKLSPAIKLVISGHSHQFYNCQIAGHTVTSAGSYGRLFTRITLSIDPRTDTVTSLSATNQVATRDVAKDLAQTAIIEKYRPAAQRISNQIVGTITDEMTHHQNAAGESQLGDMLADAQLASTSSPDSGAAVISFMNSGGIRADLIKPANANGQREVSFGDLYAVQPFGNQLTTITMTGATLRDLLEEQFPSAGKMQILQVSKGFAYQFRLNAPAGQHIVEGSITLNGHPIAPTDTLRVQANNFLIAGGAGFSAFLQGTNPVVGPTDIDALVQYFHTNSPIPPGQQNRITRID